MEPSRRGFLLFAGATAFAPAVPPPAFAIDYPTRPARWIVGFPAGGIGDVISRLGAQWLSEHLGQPFVIDDRPGAGGNIAAEAVVRSAPDGYTLLCVTISNAISSMLYDNLQFDFSRDIVPVASMVRSPFVMLVNPSFPAKTVAEFISYAKSNPGTINVGSPGTGTAAHVTGILFNEMSEIDTVSVPYRGDAPALTDLLGGHIQAYFCSLTSGIEFIKSGKLRALAVTTSTRWETLPDIPSVSEHIRGFEASGWYGVGAPRNTPIEIIDKLNMTIGEGLTDFGMKSKLSAVGCAVLPLSTAEFGKLIADETEKWGKVVRAANIKAD